jgi:hypothetical protein
MQQQQQQRQPSMLDDMRSGFNVSTFALEVAGMAYLPILRARFGVRAMQGTSFWAMLAIAAYAVAMNSRVMLCAYLPVWLLCIVWKRLGADPYEHSSYQGYPILTGWLFSNEYLARCAEAGLLWLFGAWLARVDESLGLFVTGGGFVLMAQYMLGHTIHLRRVRAAIDMQSEAEQWQATMQEVARRQKRGR